MARAAGCALQRRLGAQREHGEGTGCASDEQPGDWGSDYVLDTRAVAGAGDSIACVWRALRHTRGATSASAAVASRPH